MENQAVIASKKKIVNKKIRICIECGSSSTQMKDKGIHCKECGNFFKIKEDRN